MSLIKRIYLVKRDTETTKLGFTPAKKLNNSMFMLKINVVLITLSCIPSSRKFPLYTLINTSKDHRVLIQKCFLGPDQSFAF